MTGADQDRSQVQEGLKAYPKDLQEQAIETLDKLLHAPDLPGLNLEKLRSFKDRYTIRVNRNFRILLRRSKDSEGDFFLVLKLDSHDGTYRM